MKIAVVVLVFLDVICENDGLMSSDHAPIGARVKRSPVLLDLVLDLAEARERRIQEQISLKRAEIARLEREESEAAAGLLADLGSLFRQGRIGMLRQEVRHLKTCGLACCDCGYRDAGFRVRFGRERVEVGP